MFMFQFQFIFARFYINIHHLEMSCLDTGGWSHSGILGCVALAELVAFSQEVPKWVPFSTKISLNMGPFS